MKFLNFLTCFLFCTAVKKIGCKISKEHQKIAALYAHNFLRGLHGVPVLVWDQELADGAQRHAHTLALEGRLRHENRTQTPEYSDNLYQSSGDSERVGVYHAIHEWYSQIKIYNFNANGLRPENWLAAAFTAVIWDDVVCLGMGLAHNDKTDSVYVVARYSPAPNQPKAWKDHVKLQLKAEIDKLGGGTKVNDVHIPTVEDLIPPKYSKDKEIVFFTQT